MLCYHRPHVPKKAGIIRLPTLLWLSSIAWLNTFSWLLRELFTAMDSPQLTRHITALLEEKGAFFPSPILLFCLPLSRLRLFIQELKVKVYLRPSHCVSMALSISPFIISLLSQPESGRGKIHDTCDVSWKSREQSGTEQSVGLSVCMSHAAALERLKHREKKSVREGGTI